MLLLTLVYTWVLCCFNSNYKSELSHVECIIQADPESALKEIRCIDKNSLLRKKDYALYSLLLSMALDKNYIDISADTLIMPAVKYYSHSHDYYRKFLSYYSLGRIYENAEEYDKALSAYISASKVPQKRIPLEYNIRLHTRKGTVYYRQLALDKALEEYRRAKHLSTNAENPAFFIHSSIDVAAIQTALGHFSGAGEEMDSLRVWMANRSITPPTDYYDLNLRILLLSNSDNKDELHCVYNEYSRSVADQGKEKDHLLSAMYYLACGKTDAAADELGKLENDINKLDSFSFILYHTTLAKVQKGRGEYEAALATVEFYNNRLQEMNIAIHQKDVRYMEERARNELGQLKSKHRNIMLVSLLFVFIALVVIISLYYVRAKKQFDRELNNAKAEYNFLKEVSEPGQLYTDDVKHAINDRIQALRPYIFSARPLTIRDTDHLKKTSEKRKDMLGGIGLIYAATYPGFVSKLSGYGLTVEEIGLCCMYVSGYSAKELNPQNNTYQAYIENVAIRQKLRLDTNGIKLTTWLKSLFDATSSGMSTTLKEPLRKC